MCCLFGLLDYTGHFTGKQKNKIISILSVACEERGTDATGISYNHDEHLSVFKRPHAAHKMRFAVPDVPLIMGHTRMTTQGDEKRNYNNHPFYGKADNTEFTLAHNGVLHNDDALQKSEKLPVTKIETDSYVAVQLIEKKRELSFESLKFMAEKLLGSFTITVMDKEDNLYFIKGDNPICIYHFPEIGVYIYASTEDILKKALKKMPYRFGNGTKVEISCGDILKINRYGRIIKSKFDTELLDTYGIYNDMDKIAETNEYIFFLNFFGELIRFNKTDKTFEYVLNKIIDDFYITNESIYYVYNSELYQIDYEDKKEIKVCDFAPKNIKCDDEKIYLSDNNGTIFLVKSDSLVKIYNIKSDLRILRFLFYIQNIVYFYQVLRQIQKDAY